MALLVGYDSSEEDEERQQLEQPSVQEDQRAQEPSASSQATEAQIVKPEDAQAPSAAAATSIPPNATVIGPALPPTEGELTEAYPEEIDQEAVTARSLQSAPSSPYSASRSLIHTLTLPTVPNLDIPPSPPSSPSQVTAQAALTAKFDKFLELKRKKGTHFNARIADSHALKNPPLMDKLLGFVGVGVSFEDGAVDGTDQYATTLPTELWDPAVFPEWAYRGPLRKSQERVQKERGRERGEAVHFVPASS